MINLIYLPLTIGLFLLAQQLYKKFPTPLLNPVLVSLTALVLLLLFAQIDYSHYNQYASVLTFLLKPAVVALGVPLYQQLHSIKKELPQILSLVFVSVVIAVVSTTALALLVGASAQIAASLSPKSVTTPIAVLIADQIGGQPSIAAIAVMVTGLVGSVVGVPWLRAMRVHHPKAQGIAMGTACHALGTARIVEEGAQQGAYSAFALVLSAILSSLLCPILVPLVSAWLA
ncbi:LrgB family protein [Reinekea thalattae]|nr:LrgB family protein [Reinekea thalattae]